MAPFNNACLLFLLDHFLLQCFVSFYYSIPIEFEMDDRLTSSQSTFSIPSILVDLLRIMR
jgi:hypothetical protein